MAKAFSSYHISIGSELYELVPYLNMFMLFHSSVGATMPDRLALFVARCSLHYEKVLNFLETNIYLFYVFASVYYKRFY